VVPRGAGRLQHWGDPPDSCDLIVDTRHLDRILEHEPAESTVTVQAGVRLTDLEQVVESGGQTLALLPPRQASVGTVGGLIATNAAGRMRSADCATRPPTPGRWCAWRSRLASSPGR
jgi:glycolate oxidase FAD binding subunit